MRRLLLILALLIAALPAHAQPGAEEQQRLLLARIDAAMGQGLLTLDQFRPMGGAPDPETGGRIAYVAVRLRLARDHDFGAWEGGTLQALAAALGAGPRGINGAARGGNRTAMQSLARIYELGLGVPADAAQSALWKQRSEEN